MTKCNQLSDGGLKLVVGMKQLKPLEFLALELGQNDLFSELFGIERW